MLKSAKIKNFETNLYSNDYTLLSAVKKEFYVGEVVGNIERVCALADLETTARMNDIQSVSSGDACAK